MRQIPMENVNWAGKDASKTVPVPLSCQVKPYLSRFLACPAFLPPLSCLSRFLAACLKCLDLDRAKVRTYAEQFTWDRCTDMVLANLAANPTPGTQPGVPALAGMA